MHKRKVFFGRYWMSGKTVTRVNRGTDAGEGVINLIAGIHLMDELENMMN